MRSLGFQSRSAPAGPPGGSARWTSARPSDPRTVSSYLWIVSSSRWMSFRGFRSCWRLVRSWCQPSTWQSTSSLMTWSSVGSQAARLPWAASGKSSSAGSYQSSKSARRKGCSFPFAPLLVIWIDLELSVLNFTKSLYFNDGTTRFKMAGLDLGVWSW